MDLAHPNAGPWRTKLVELSDLYSAIAPELRPRVDTRIDWLDVAALSNRWRIIIPAIFSEMEAAPRARKHRSQGRGRDKAYRKSSARTSTSPGQAPRRRTSTDVARIAE